MASVLLDQIGWAVEKKTAPSQVISIPALVFTWPLLNDNTSNLLKPKLMA